ncbi:MAG: tetratricopeptide repeat protein [Bacteroidales bacterium]|nr:tetratricopeptide repeat protein [Bacteroidales bacterium]
MRKITLLILTTLFSFTFAYSQTSQTVEGLLKDKAKSDEDILNPKKNVKSATWEKRGDIFLDIAQFNTKGIYKSMPQKGFNGAEFIAGKPNEILTEGDEEIWVYERIKLTFVNGLLTNWLETKPIVENAIDISRDAYLKAFDLDEKGKVKEKDLVKQNIATLRGLYADQGIKYFQEKDNKKAYQSFEEALKLNKFPKVSGDTVFDAGLLTYYAGVFAQNANDIDKAEEFYKTAVDNSYQEGLPYHGLASIYSEQGKEDKELDILTKGFEKYPDSKELLFDFINFYLRIGNSHGALENIDKAIQVNPENFSLYFAKGTLFDSMAKDTTGKYTVDEKIQIEKDAVTAYEKSLEIKPDYFNSLYNLGALYYNRAAAILKKADDLPLNAKAEYDALKEKADENFKLSIPYLEKASEVQDDRMTLQTLSTMYRRLGMYEKNNAVKEKIENLPAEGEGF